MFGLAPGWSWTIVTVAAVILFVAIDIAHHKLMKRNPVDTVPEQLDDFREWRADEADELFQ